MGHGHRCLARPLWVSICSLRCQVLRKELWQPVKGQTLLFVWFLWIYSCYVKWDFSLKRLLQLVHWKGRMFTWNNVSFNCGLREISNEWSDLKETCSFCCIVRNNLEKGRSLVLFFETKKLTASFYLPRCELILELVRFWYFQVCLNFQESFPNGLIILRKDFAGQKLQWYHIVAFTLRRAPGLWAAQIWVWQSNPVSSTVSGLVSDFPPSLYFYLGYLPSQQSKILVFQAIAEGKALVRERLWLRRRER